MSKRARHKQRATGIDCPPERLQHSPSHWVNPAEIDSAEQNIGRNRRFAPRIDQLHRLGCLTTLQFKAAEWWFNRVEEAYGLPRVIADYGQSNGRGNADPSPLPLSNRAERARLILDKAKRELPLQVRAAIEEAIDPDTPSLIGGSSTRRLMRWREALDVLSVWIANARI